MTPTTSADFDRAYRAPITFWGDVRIPDEIKALTRHGTVRTALELGCGVGRFSRYVAGRGVRTTGIDFSPVAIERARAGAKNDPSPPDFRVGDVTRLDALEGPFDVAYDVGCFHCLDADGQRRYVSETSRLIAPGGTLLIWTLDSAPSDLALTPDTMRGLFAPGFTLRDASVSRRRLVKSHWYWLTRHGATSH